MQNLDEEVNPLVTDLEEHNALALAIVAPGTEDAVKLCCQALSNFETGVSSDVLVSACR